jgi:hypothetical protein
MLAVGEALLTAAAAVELLTAAGVPMAVVAAVLTAIVKLSKTSAFSQRLAALECGGPFAFSVLAPPIQNAAPQLSVRMRVK